MMPTPTNEVMTRTRELISSRLATEPMWSKSVWVSQIHCSVLGSISDERAVRKSAPPATVPVSTRRGSVP
jgi:hypothetical protein